MSHADGRNGLDRAFVVTGLIDQLDLRIANIIIDARPIFAGDGRGFIGTANGWFSKVVKEAAILQEDVFAGKQFARTDRKTLKCEVFRSRLGTLTDIDTLLAFRKRPKRAMPGSGPAD
ncbi:hypothetical protein [Bradyrhizobium sp. 199]|uniref:hypothetical protein n=1 Tax=Bradyrhizobium sp. 199 TaxID=2782664 RepID=UPI001FF7F63E